MTTPAIPPGTAEAGELRKAARDCIAANVPLRGRWVTAIMDRVIAPLLAECASLRDRLEAVERTRRWIVEEYDDGLMICRGHHDRSEECDFVQYVPAERVDALTAENATLRAALEKTSAALKLSAHERNIIRFTGRWAHLGKLPVGEILTEANTALTPEAHHGQS